MQIGYGQAQEIEGGCDTSISLEPECALHPLIHSLVVLDLSLNMVVCQRDLLLGYNNEVGFVNRGESGFLVNSLLWSWRGYYVSGIFQQTSSLAVLINVFI